MYVTYVAQEVGDTSEGDVRWNKLITTYVRTTMRNYVPWIMLGTMYTILKIWLRINSNAVIEEKTTDARTYHQLVSFYK